jgi:hypothetical protein
MNLYNFCFSENIILLNKIPEVRQKTFDELKRVLWTGRIIIFLPYFSFPQDFEICGRRKINQLQRISQFGILKEKNYF